MATKNDSSTRNAQFEQAARDLAEASGGLSVATQALEWCEALFSSIKELGPNSANAKRLADMGQYLASQAAAAATKADEQADARGLELFERARGAA